MKDFIKQRLKEDLNRYYQAKPNAISDKYQIGEYDDYDFDDYGFDDLDIIDEPIKPSKKISGDIKAFHGSPHKISNFSDEFVGGEEANDQEGPGIYFTTDSSDAVKYAEGGGYVYEVNLKVNNLVSNEPKSNLEYLTKPITKLIKMNPNWKNVAKGYDEGLDDMVAQYIHMAQSEKEAFVAVYMNVYKENATMFVRNMVKLGYDGLYLPMKDEGAHIVIYNPSLIRVVNSKQIN